MCDTTAEEGSNLPPELEVIKDIPCYRVILKAILRYQIQQLLTQLSDYTEEESIILSTCVSDGTFSYLGTRSGKTYLEQHKGLKTSFMNFCMQKQNDQQPSEFPDSSPNVTSEQPGGRHVNLALLRKDGSISTGQVYVANRCTSAAQSSVATPPSSNSKKQTHFPETCLPSAMPVSRSSQIQGRQKFVKKKNSSTKPSMSPTQTLLSASPSSVSSQQRLQCHTVRVPTTGPVSKSSQKRGGPKSVTKRNSRFSTTNPSMSPVVKLHLLPRNITQSVRLKPCIKNVPSIIQTRSGKRKASGLPVLLSSPRKRSTNLESSMHQTENSACSSTNNETNIRIQSVQGTPQESLPTLSTSEPEVKIEVDVVEPFMLLEPELNNVDSSLAYRTSTTTTTEFEPLPAQYLQESTSRNNQYSKETQHNTIETRNTAPNTPATLNTPATQYSTLAQYLARPSAATQNTSATKYSTLSQFLAGRSAETQNTAIQNIGATQYTPETQNTAATQFSTGTQNLTAGSATTQYAAGIQYSSGISAATPYTAASQYSTASQYLAEGDAATRYATENQYLTATRYSAESSTLIPYSAVTQNSQGSLATTQYSAVTQNSQGSLATTQYSAAAQFSPVTQYMYSDFPDSYANLNVGVGQQLLGADNQQLLGAHNQQLLGADNQQLLGAENKQALSSEYQLLPRAENQAVLRADSHQLLGADNQQLLEEVNQQVHRANGQLVLMADNQQLLGADNQQPLEGDNQWKQSPGVESLDTCAGLEDMIIKMEESEDDGDYTDMEADQPRSPGEGEVDMEPSASDDVPKRNLDKNVLDTNLASGTQLKVNNEAVQDILENPEAAEDTPEQLEAAESIKEDPKTVHDSQEHQKTAENTPEDHEVANYTSEHDKNARNTPQALKAANNTSEYLKTTKSPPKKSKAGHDIPEKDKTLRSPRRAKTLRSPRQTKEAETGASDDDSGTVISTLDMECQTVDFNDADSDFDAAVAGVDDDSDYIPDAADDDDDGGGDDRDDGDVDADDGQDNEALDELFENADENKASKGTETDVTCVGSWKQRRAAFYKNIQLNDRKEASKKWQKLKFCPFCKIVNQSKLSGHILAKHMDEEKMREIATMPKGSKERNDALAHLRNEGRYQHNVQVLQEGKGTLVVSKRPTKGEGDRISAMHYLPCVFCLQFIYYPNIHKHHVNCSLRPKMMSRDLNAGRNGLILLQPFMMRKEERKRLLQELMMIITSMRKLNKVPKLRETCSTDELILEFGICTFQRVGDKKMKGHYNKISLTNKMRLLAQLLAKLNENKTARGTLSDFICVKKFAEVAAAVKALSRNSIKLASLMEDQLKQICLLKSSLARKKNDLRKLKEATDFQAYFTHIWESACPSPVTAEDEEFLTTDDLPTLTTFAKAEIQRLVDDPDLTCEKYRHLARALFVRVLLVNARTVAEVEDLMEPQFEARLHDCDSQRYKDKEASLSLLEKALSKRLDMMDVHSKPTEEQGNSHVLLPSDVVHGISYLLGHRDSLDVMSYNRYLFAETRFRHLDGNVALKKMCSACPGIGKPKVMRTGDKQQYMATVCQINEMTEVELQVVVEHLEKVLKIHTSLEKLQTSAVDRRKAAKLLVSGTEKLRQLEGKALEDMDFKAIAEACRAEDDSKVTADSDAMETETTEKADGTGRDESDAENGSDTDSYVLDDETGHFESKSKSKPQDSIKDSNSNVKPEKQSQQIACPPRIKRKRWSVQENRDFRRAFSTQIKKKVNVTWLDIKTAHERYPSLKDRTPMMIRTRVNNIILGKCKL